MVLFYSCYRTIISSVIIFVCKISLIFSVLGILLVRYYPPFTVTIQIQNGCLSLRRVPMKLNVRQVETAKPGEKDYKLPDGNGLILLVNTSGAKYWWYRYTFAGKEKMLHSACIWLFRWPPPERNEMKPSVMLWLA